MSLKHPILGTPLPLGWRIASVNEIKAPVHGACVAGPFGSSISAKYFVDDGVPVIRGSTLTDDLTKFVDDGFVFISEEYATNFPSQQVVADDLVFTCWGTIGQVGIVPKASRFPRYVISNKQLKLRIDPSVALPEYIYYHFAGPSAAEYIRSRAVGAAVPGINLGILKAFPVALPPLATQQQIARILDTLGDLIDNNLRRIRVLEDMAQAQWEHVEKAATQRQPLSACADFLSGGTPSKARTEYWRGDVPWVSSRELTRMRLQDTELHVTEEGADAGSRVVPANTILAVVRGMSLATEFRIGLTSRAMAFNQDLKAIVPRVGLDGLVLFHALRAQRDQIRGRATEAAHGTKKLDSDVLGKVMIPVPSETEQRAFRECVAPIHELWDRLERSNNTLRKLRDLLLPKLLSGGIDVSRLPLPPE